MFQHSNDARVNDPLTGCARQGPEALLTALKDILGCVTGERFVSTQVMTTHTRTFSCELVGI